MEYKLTGQIKIIKETQQVSEKFQKREFVISDNSSMYPQDVLFQLAQDACNKLDGFKEGETIEVSFNLRGREWTSPQGEIKYFNTLDAWRIEKINEGQSAPSGPEDLNTKTADDDDLPF